MGVFSKKNRHVSSGNGATIIAAGCIFKGELSGLKTPLYVEGRIEGVVASEAEIVIGPKGYVEGEVRAKHIVVNGELVGNVVCEQMDIMSAGCVRGELMSRHMTIENGGRFLGTSHEIGADAQVNILEVQLVEMGESSLAPLSLQATEKATKIQKEQQDQQDQQDQ